MSGQCIICLSTFKEPVSIPCGHIYCSQCLSDHIATSSEDGYNSLCPTCRSPFPIVSPELSCIPKHAHRYITPSIRRVYLDSTATQTLEKKLNASQTQVRNLKQESDRLMELCETHMYISRVHAEGEAKATLEVQRLEGLLNQERRRCAKVREEAEEWREKHEAAVQKQPGSRKSSRKRDSLFHEGSSEGSRSQLSDESPAATPLTPRRRVIRDLPNRPKKKLKPSLPPVSMEPKISPPSWSWLEDDPETEFDF